MKAAVSQLAKRIQEGMPLHKIPLELRGQVSNRGFLEEDLGMFTHMSLLVNKTIDPMPLFKYMGFPCSDEDKKTPLVLKGIAVEPYGEVDKTHTVILFCQHHGPAYTKIKGPFNTLSRLV